ncbi:hypothetical protein [Cellvibrio sp. NN19]|uniref:hypothetical protein n=1 Tax=Cellvibrio chitinivorans TaxID=3102792 RepID=UPI002B415B77|nr:hypothetical protein [Cellvibrio sp. NN19]
MPTLTNSYVRLLIFLRSNTSFCLASLRWLSLASVALLSLQVNAGNISARAEYSALYDSNFSRSEVEQDETIKIAALKVNADQKFSKQNISAILQFNQLDYETDKSLDSSYATGEFNWQGQMAKKILFDANATRDAYAVDPLEYKEKDIITRNEYFARVGYGSREKLSVWIGGVNIKQNHSAYEREILDFEQPAAVVEITMFQSQKLQHNLSFTKGERSYKTGMNIQGNIIDFDFSEIEYDLDWKMSERNQISLGVAGFEREGDINSDTGLLANVRWMWKPRSKLSLLLGFDLNQPAAGEEIETPTEVRNTSVGARWQLSDRWRLEADFLHSEQDYINQTTYEERGEKWQRWRPLVIIYSGPKWFSARLETELYERRSSAVYRVYEGTVVNLALAAKF